MQSYETEDRVSEGTDYFTLVRELIPRVRKYAAWFWVGIAFLAVAMILTSAVPYLVGVAIDRGVMAGDRATLFKVGGLILGLEAAKMAAQFVYRYSLQIVGQHVMFDLRVDLFRHVLRLPVPYFDRHPSGRVVTRLSNDVSTLGDLFSSGIVVVVGDVCIILGAIAFMFYMDLKLTLIFLATFPAMMWAARFFGRRMKTIYRQVRARLARINGFLGERLNPNALSTIKLFRAEEKVLGRFTRIVEDYFQDLMQSTRTYGYFHPVVTILTAAGVALILYWGGVAHWSGEITIGVLVAFLAYSQNIHMPIRDIIDKYNIFQSAMSSGERIWTVLNERAEESRIEVAAAPSAKHQGTILVPTVCSGGVPSMAARTSGEGRSQPRKLPARVEFQDVTFSYDGGAPVLKGISLSLLAGKKNALVGATGCGKTTLVHLLLRFYELNSGRILLDGEDIRLIDRPSLRRRIGLVSQEPFLFSGVLEEALSMGDQGRSEAQRIESIITASPGDRPGQDGREKYAGGDGTGVYAEYLEGYGLAHVLEKARKVVRGGGVNLSMGERQIFSLLRLLQYDPEIVVLDEATSYVDSSSEEKINRVLTDLLRDRTTLIIAHRHSTVWESDHIWVMRRGELFKSLSGDEFRAGSAE